MVEAVSATAESLCNTRILPDRKENMTETTVLLIALLLGGTVLAAFELQRRNMRDVLEAVGLFVLGLVLGVVAQVLIPGGILLGVLGGAALGKTRFDEVRHSRMQALAKEIEGVENVSERRIILFNALERAEPKSTAARRFLGMAVVVFLSIVSVISLLVGLIPGNSPLLLIGGLAAALPVSAWASQTIRTEEREFLEKAMVLCGDEAAGVLPHPGSVERLRERA